jgi:hypothetical protein
MTDVDEVKQHKIGVSVPTKRCTPVRIRHNSKMPKRKFVRIVVIQFQMNRVSGGTYEGMPLVVGAAAGSLIVTPPSIGRISMFNEWLIMYMCSAVGRSPVMRSTEQGNDAFVTEYGVSQTCSINFQYCQIDHKRY